MHQEVSVIGQNPLRLAIALQAQGQLTVLFQPQADLVADGLDIALVGARADHEVIGEGGDAGKVQHTDIDSLFGFGCANGYQPGWGFRWIAFGRIGLLRIDLGQNTLPDRIVLQ